MKTGIELIAEERERQIEVEGWTPEQDYRHNRQELARAAACYAVPPRRREVYEEGEPYDWPWDGVSWKPVPDDRIRELQKAGALIAAEIDRLQRKNNQ